MTIVSYAQNLEDVMLQRALSYVRNGCYVDVGASLPGKVKLRVLPARMARNLYRAARIRGGMASAAAGGHLHQRHRW
jgi:hypothetical protein